MCLTVCGSVGLFTIDLKHIYVNLGSGLELKSANCTSKRLGILPKIRGGGAIVSGFGSKQPLQQQATSACFIEPVKCVFPVFLSGCEQLHWKYMLDFSDFVHLARSVLNQSDCRFSQLNTQETSYEVNFYMTRHS